MISISISDQPGLRAVISWRALQNRTLCRHHKDDWPLAQFGVLSPACRLELGASDPQGQGWAGGDSSLGVRFEFWLSRPKAETVAEDVAA